MELQYINENVYDKVKDLEDINSLAEEYKTFLNSCRTERQCAEVGAKFLEKCGFTKYANKKIKAGDRQYIVYKNKVVIAIIGGKKSLDKGVNLIASHVDSPRLDLKPHPVYEDSGLAMIKTHYYGGVKKYQWTTVPLMLTGVIVKGDGTKVKVNIGERESDPIFYISDLLPHLAADQMDRKLREGVKGEELNVLGGLIPFDGDDEEEIKKPVKENVLRILNERYGIVEEDLITSELTFVPALKARDAGFDSSMIAAYGQDDKVCAYTSLRAITDVAKPDKTCLCVWADKEEIGSMGVTGMQSDFLINFLSRLADNNGVNIYDIIDNSVCLSADVDAAYDPTYKGAYDVNNSAKLGCGLVLTKYTGARGKSGTSDASAELAGKVRKIFNDNEVIWQMGELGKVDKGGGGTVAQFIANRGIDTIDCGVAVISMHAPYELTAKSDVYMAYKGYKAFYESK